MKGFKMSATMAGSKTSHFKYTVANGKVSVFVKATGETEEFTTDKLPSEIRDEVLSYGLKQLLSDRSAAIPDTSGKVTQMKETYSDLLNGVWTGGRSGDASGLSKAHIEFAEAAAKAKNLDVEAIKASLLAMEPDTENAAGNTVAGDRTLYVREKSKMPSIAAALAEIALEKAKAKAKALKASAKIAEEGSL
jgi:regulator of protease activity HflC (stomatin/prohibitin superfamily)